LPLSVLGIILGLKTEKVGTDFISDAADEIITL
jgi:hypothetical protein